VTLVLIGLAVGVLYGALGAGGSAFATPLLALAGVPAAVAVASPLPATLPAALVGAWSYRRSGDVVPDVARRATLVGLPCAVLGALASGLVPGAALLALSAVLLVVMGVRMLADGDSPGMPVVPACAGVGFAAGLLANSGGFLLVPVFVMVGLGMRRAAGTSLMVAAALSIPTLATHLLLGHIDWSVAVRFAAGLVPATLLGSWLSRALPPERTQRTFGAVLLLFAGWFLVRQLL